MGLKSGNMCVVGSGVAGGSTGVKRGRSRFPQATIRHNTPCMLCTLVLGNDGLLHVLTFPMDLFESALNLEERHIQEGYDEGVRDGRRLGEAEGKALGAQKGFEIGHEVGFYAGCTQVWRQLQMSHPDAFNPRADKAIAAIEELVQEFPLDNALDERLQELMDGLRGKFKAAVAMLGLQEAFLTPAQEPPSLQF